MMMVLVNVSINGFDMQGPMYDGVEKVKDNKEEWQGQDDRFERDLRQAPQDIGFKIAIP
jgi:hypothetical protein